MPALNGKKLFASTQRISICNGDMLWIQFKTFVNISCGLIIDYV